MVMITVKAEAIETPNPFSRYKRAGKKEEFLSPFLQIPSHELAGYVQAHARVRTHCVCVCVYIYSGLHSVARMLHAGLRSESFLGAAESRAVLPGVCTARSN